jgi:hypothetical protein
MTSTCLSRIIKIAAVLGTITALPISHSSADDSVCRTSGVFPPEQDGNTIKAGISVSCNDRVKMGGNINLESLDPLSGEIHTTWTNPFEFSDTADLPPYYVTLDCSLNPSEPRFTFHRLHAWWGAYVNGENVGSDEIITDWVQIGGCPLQ